MFGPVELPRRKVSLGMAGGFARCDSDLSDLPIVLSREWLMSCASPSALLLSNTSESAGPLRGSSSSESGALCPVIGAPSATVYRFLGVGLMLGCLGEPAEDGGDLGLNARTGVS